MPLNWGYDDGAKENDALRLFHELSQQERQTNNKEDERPSVPAPSPSPYLHNGKETLLKTVKGIIASWFQ